MDNVGLHTSLFFINNKQMPYKSEQIKIAGTKHDKRIKLTKDDKNAIIILTQKGYSQRKLAILFGVSRRLIQNTIKPQPRSSPRPRSAEYWAEAKRKYRKRKNELLQTNKIRMPKKKTISKACHRKPRKDND